MSQAQLCEVCRVLCIIASALTFVSAMGYFVFSKGSESEKAAQLRQLLSTNQSLTAQVAGYEGDLLLKEQRIAEMEKERVAKAKEIAPKTPDRTEPERAISEQEALFLLAAPVEPDLASLLTPEPKPSPAPPIPKTIPPRQLNPAQYSELVTALRGAPPVQVDFLFNDTDEEAAALARQLSSAISEAGFKKVAMPPPGKRFDWKPPVTGVRCAIAEGRPAPAMVEPFMRVLKKSGLQVDGVINANVPKTEHPLAWIMVGARPPAH